MIVISTLNERSISDDSFLINGIGRQGRPSFGDYPCGVNGGSRRQPTWRARRRTESGQGVLKAVRLRDGRWVDRETGAVITK